MFRVFADATPFNSQSRFWHPTPLEQKKKKANQEKKQCGRNVFESPCQSFGGCHLHFKQTVKASWSWLPSNSLFATMWQGGHVGNQFNTIFSRRIYMKMEMLWSWPPSWSPLCHVQTITFDMPLWTRSLLWLGIFYPTCEVKQINLNVHFSNLIVNSSHCRPLNPWKSITRKIAKISPSKYQPPKLVTQNTLPLNRPPNLIPQGLVLGNSLK